MDLHLTHFDPDGMSAALRSSIASSFVRLESGPFEMHATFQEFPLAVYGTGVFKAPFQAIAAVPDDAYIAYFILNSPMPVKHNAVELVGSWKALIPPRTEVSLISKGLEFATYRIPRRI